MAFGLWYRMKFIRSFFFLMSLNDEHQAFVNFIKNPKFVIN